jgi:hypothetical protein
MHRTGEQPNHRRAQAGLQIQFDSSEIHSKVSVQQLQNFQTRATHPIPAAALFCNMMEK